MKKNYYLLLVVAFVLSINSHVFGQASAYQFTPSLGTYAAVTGTALSTTNLCQQNVALGFTFDFEGTGYTTVDVSEDGYLSFGTSTFCSAFNDLDNSPANRLPLVAPLWDNLNLDAPGAITGLPSTQFEHTTTGAAGSQIWTGQWTDVHWNQLSSAGVISFQVKLFEGTNCIEFHYEQGTGAVNGASASIGIAGASTFLSVQNTTLTPTTSSTVETTTISTKPASGQIYQFCPPTCPTPSLDSISISGITTTTATATWVSGSTATDWETEYGVSGFTLGTGANNLISGTPTQNITGLVAGTQYDFYVRDICGPADSSLWAGPVTFWTAFVAPVTEDYDSNPAGINTTFDNGWTSFNSSPGAFNYNWWTRNTPTTSTNTGPGVDHTTGISGGGNYVYTEASNGPTGSTATLLSPTYDVSALTNPTLRFWYHKFGNTMPDMFITADSGNGNFDINLDTLFGETHTAEAPGDPWDENVMSLTSFVGSNGTIQIRFQGTRTSFGGDMAVDDFEIFDQLNDDARMTSLEEPVDGGCEGMKPITVEFQNNGLDTINPGDLNVGYSINGLTPVIEAVNQTILPFDKATHTFAALGNLPSGIVSVFVWTDLTADGFLGNDTIIDSLDIAPVIDSTCYQEGFENGNGGWTTGGTGTWAIGTPSGSYINAAANGIMAAVTNLSGAHQNNENSFLLSPCFDFSAYDKDPVLEFSHIYEIETNFDENWVDISFDGGANWDRLGKAGEGTNWYNDPANDWWEGNSPGGSGVWGKARITLEDAAGEADVKIRFFFSSDGSVTNDGAGVDDITIVVPPSDNFLGDSVSTCNDPNFTLDAGHPGYSYLWSTGDTTQIITVSSGGVYSVTITEPKLGIQATDDIVVVTQPAPVISFDNSNAPDSLREDQNIAIFTDPLLSPATHKFKWTFNSILDTLHFYVARGSEMGVGTHTVFVEVEDNLKCSSSFNHTVEVLPLWFGINTLNGSQVNYYPNPAHDKLNIELSGQAGLGAINVSILDNQGRIVLSTVLTDNTGSLRSTIDLEGLAKGMYILQLATDAGTLNEKLVIE